MRESLFRGFLPVCLYLLVPFLSPKAVAQEAELPPVLLQMSRDPAIHRELKLSSSQVAQVLRATDAVDGRWWTSRIRPDEERRKIVRELTTELWDSLLKILNENQRERMHQLESQALGTRMFLTGRVADALRLDNTVRRRIRDAAIATDIEAATLQKKLASGGDANEINRQLQKLKNQEQETIVSALTLDQQRKLTEVVGPSFDFSKVRRDKPRAPELISQTEDWLQGQPLKLKELRGKVVVLHFYAFQCINCQRNLPHYSGWFNDFASDDVVVIGIQTPETATESDPARVRESLVDQDIRYSVLFDGGKSNWNAWGNTMWPTVYLIDRDGFIRTWWQGELNWQGAKGEETFRQIIGQLVESQPQQ